MGSVAGYDTAFKTLAAANAAVSTWVTAGDMLIWECHSEGSMPLTEASVIIGADGASGPEALGSTGTLKIRVKAGEWHRGVIGGGFQWQSTTLDGGNWLQIAVAAANCPTIVLERFDIPGAAVTATTYGIRVAEDGTNQVTVRDTIVGGFTGSTVIAFYTTSGIAQGVLFRDCLAYDLVGHGFWSTAATGPDIFEHCTADGCSVTGFNESAATNPIYINCLGTNNGTDFPAGYTSGSYCASEDGTAPTTLGPLTGVDPAVEYRDVANNDYRLRNIAECARSGTVGTKKTDIGGFTREYPGDRGAYGRRKRRWTGRGE